MRIDWNDAISSSIIDAMASAPIVAARAELPLVFSVVFLGLLAGILTTIAGQGGGLMLLLACSSMLGPHAALAVTAPALLFGNLHRSILLRGHIDRSVAGARSSPARSRARSSAVSSSDYSGVGAPRHPCRDDRHRGRESRRRLPLRGAAPCADPYGDAPRRDDRHVGRGRGALRASAPLFRALRPSVRGDIERDRPLHAPRPGGRLRGLGPVLATLVLPTIAITVAIFAGNAIGDRLRGFFSERLTSILEYGTLVVCVVLSVAGLG